MKDLRSEIKSENEPLAKRSFSQWYRMLKELRIIYRGCRWRRKPFQLPMRSVSSRPEPRRNEPTKASALVYFSHGRGDRRNNAAYAFCGFIHPGVQRQSTPFGGAIL